MSCHNVTEYDMNTEEEIFVNFLIDITLICVILTHRDAVQVVLYYNNKEIKGEKKHLGNSVFSIKGSHLFCRGKCNEKGREKNVLLNILSSYSCLHCHLVLTWITKAQSKSFRIKTWDQKDLVSTRLNVSYMKNCEPFVLAPRLAIDSKKGLSCLKMNPSSVKRNVN